MRILTQLAIKQFIKYKDNLLFVLYCLPIKEPLISPLLEQLFCTKFFLIKCLRKFVICNWNNKNKDKNLI